MNFLDEEIELMQLPPAETAARFERLAAPVERLLDELVANDFPPSVLPEVASLLLVYFAATMQWQDDGEPDLNGGPLPKPSKAHVRKALGMTAGILRANERM